MTQVRANSPASLAFGPTRGSRVGGWAILVFGVIFAMSGLAGDVVGGVTMAVAGAVFAGIGICVVTTRVAVNAQELSYRYGFRKVLLPATEISSVEVGAGSGRGYGRLTVVVRSSTGRLVRLTTLQGPSTTGTKSRLEAQAREMRDALGLRQPDE